MMWPPPHPIMKSALIPTRSSRSWRPIAPPTSEAGAARLHRTPGPDTLERINLWLLEKGRSYSATDLVRARDVLNRGDPPSRGVFPRLRRAPSTPALASMPPSIGHLNGDMVDPEQPSGLAPAALRPSATSSTGTGQPAISLPATRTSGGLPVWVRRDRRSARAP